MVHTLTTSGLIFIVTGIALLPSEVPLLAPVYALLGYFFAIKEITKYTSGYQFFTVFFSAFVVGLSLDITWLDLPLFTSACSVAATGSIGRVVFFRNFGYIQYRWFEPMMFFMAVLLYLLGNFIHPSNWQGWIFPAFIISLQGVLSGDAFKDQTQLYMWARNREKQLIKSEKGGRGLLGFTNGCNKLEEGTIVPGFSLQDQDGNIVSLSDFIGRKSLLLIFVRGDWCAGCHMMLRAYELENRNLQGRDILLLAISPDSVGVNREMGIKLGLKFQLLSDAGLLTAMKYGIVLPEYDNFFAVQYKEGMPLPTLFLVDKKGTIRYTSSIDKTGVFLNSEMAASFLKESN